MADQEARIRRIQRRLPSSHSSAGPAGTNERSRFASSAAATPPRASSASLSSQGLTARAAAQAAVAIRWPRPIGILETRGPKPNAVACPRGVAFCAISRRCQHVSIAAVAAVPLVPSRGRPRPYAPMEQSSWRAAQATRRIFASWGVRHPGVGVAVSVSEYTAGLPRYSLAHRGKVSSPFVWVAHAGRGVLRRARYRRGP